MRNVPLHFGQNSRKFSKTVSLRICVRVFPPQAGHRIHRAASILRPPYYDWPLDFTSSIIA